jgi:hypothetical protein
MKEPKTSYYLKAIKGENRPVILVVSFGYKAINPVTGKTKYSPMIYDTGVKIKEAHWDKSKNLPTLIKDFSAIEEVKEKALNTYRHLFNQGTKITPEILKSELDILLKRNRVKVNKVVGLCDFIQKKIIEPATLDKKTIKQYKVLKGKLEDYEKRNNIKLHTENFNRKHYLDFQAKCKTELNKNNAVWGVMKNLKSVLNKIRREYKVEVFNPTNDLARQEKIKLVYDQKVYLEYSQIQKIVEYKPESEKLKNVKLILLTLLFSGCRYSDVFKIKPDNKYDKDGVSFRYAHFISEKGEGTEIIVPFLLPLEEAFKENGEKMAYPISDVKFNVYVKELCELAKLNDEVKLAFTNSNGNKKFEYKPLYKFISSHIGRRSFITNLINFVPITLLSKITGHNFKDKDVIFKYNKMTLLQSAVLFVKELKRLNSDPDRISEFPIKLID